MKRALIVCFFLLVCQTSTKCAENTFPIFPPLQPLQPLQPVQPVNSDAFNSNNLAQTPPSNVTSFPDPYAQKLNPNYNDITKIEQKLFGKTYSNQNISTRLSRIEKSLFSTTYSSSPDNQRIDNIISNFNQINKYPDISTTGLSRLESQIFNEKFPQSSAQRRIERLEEQLFGAVQSGDLDARYRTLQIAVKNAKRATNNSDSFDMNMGSGFSSMNTAFSNGFGLPRRGLRGLAANFGNPFWGGTMTGFTPPIMPFNNYNNYSGYNNYDNYNGYSPGRYGSYRGVRTNHGYSDRFSDFGTGTGVTILD